MKSDNKIHPDQFRVNEAWIMARLDTLMSVKDQTTDVYVLLDAASTYAFGHIVYVGEKPSTKEIKALFKRAMKMKNSWPVKLIVVKEDPLETELSLFAKTNGIKYEVVPLPYLDHFLIPLKEGFRKFNSRKPDDEAGLFNGVDPKDLLPGSYDLCSCGSGNKYKFCCKSILREITEAMCAADEGHLDDALKWLEKAKEKVGETAELLCRYAIVYSYKSEEVYLDYLSKCLKKAEHPRANYLLGIHHKLNGDLELAIESYMKAIDLYPVTDKYHLNEVWNNLGTVFFEMAEYEKAKGAWEKALMYFPQDDLSKENLVESIYSNHELDDAIREPSPFIKRYL